MSDKKKKKTKPGAMDDDATKRVKDRNKMLQSIFNDNKSGRYSGPTDK